MRREPTGLRIGCWARGAAQGGWMSREGTRRTTHEGRGTMLAGPGRLGRTGQGAAQQASMPRLQAGQGRSGGKRVGQRGWHGHERRPVPAWERE